MAKLSEELLAAAEEAEQDARAALADGQPKWYEVSMGFAAMCRRLAAAHAGTANDPEQFIGRSTAEVANELGLTVSHVRRLARELGIGRRIGRDWRFSGNDVEALRGRHLAPPPNGRNENG